MAPFPLPLEQIFGHWGQYVVYLLIGVGFGWALESSGFSRSTKLAAQFYFKEMTVLKVMFGAIVVAMVLVFLTTGLGLLDYNLVWVNPTYMMPGIVGGLIMGAGFIIGGFCPGTSLVAAATGKIDGIFFVLGTAFGILLFGESVDLFEAFYHSTNMGRVTLMDFFNTSTGVVVIGVVLMALGAFVFAELAERYIGKMGAGSRPKWRYALAGLSVVMALAVALVGQPTNADRWARLAPTKDQLLADRAVQIDPGEMLSIMHDNALRVIPLDVRSEADFNLFHLRDARNVQYADLPNLRLELQQSPPNTVVVVMGNGEAAATEAWKYLVAESVPNVYILGGGLNTWISTFGDAAFKQEHPLMTSVASDALAFRFTAALGARYPAADPNPDVFRLPFEKKVRLDNVRGAKSGGCG